ncbi:hypothetical protein JMJ35_006529 [Cladonia borealis]|uniref:Pisatin demethylase n=1 Tax=Cladonia borealis TaxID=184061 RepID=A0AA39QXC4_9LECA|nr:hypothetical protein JMJ35_006529 [Cladonia borealis]
MADLQKHNISSQMDRLRDASGFALIFGAMVTVITIQLIRTWWRLRHIPGPFLASLTNIQRVWWVKTKRAHLIHQQMHEKYGDVVRFGPNMVSISDPSVISTVYPIRPGFPKSDFYKVLMPYTKQGALPAVFNTRDEKLHKQIKSPIAPLFSLSNAVTFESFIDEVLEVLCRQIDQRYIGSQDIVDLGNWLQYFAFDVMGTMTFSKRYGFLEQGQDVGGMLETIWEYMRTTAPVTQIPWYDEWWNKNPWIAMWRQPFGFSILKIVGDNISRRLSEKDGGGAESTNQLNNRDMLSRFMEIQSTNESIPPWSVTAWTFSNVIAGSDSTAAILHCVWYNLLAHPVTLDRLHAELLAAEQAQAITRPFPKWSEVCDLPYLDACINEAVRLHPPFCLPFERVVPEGGVEICGHFFKGGTVVGMSPYVANRHRGTWGEESNLWRPERWLNLGEEEHRILEQSMLTFGAGRRVCLGKHIAMLEMKKLVPALVLAYKIELVDPAAFKVENSWFFRQKGLGVRIKRHTEA